MEGVVSSNIFVRYSERQLESQNLNVISVHLNSSLTEMKMSELF